MKGVKSFLIAAGIVLAATIGAGIFSLPYVFKVTGWIAGGFYLFLLSGLVIGVHYLYWKILERVNEKERLLGLVKIYLGQKYFWAALVVIVVGLFLVMVAYLVLADKFIRLIFPGSGFIGGVTIFWLLSSLPLFFKLPRIAALESLAVALMVVLIVIIFFTSGISAGVPHAAGNFSALFFAFGPIIFSLEAWTAIEPIFDFQKRGNYFNPKKVLISGTLASSFLYFIFVLAILSLAPNISPDTVSGLTGWSYWKLFALGWLGLFAIWTSYLPIGLEIKNALEKDLKMKSYFPFSPFAAVVFLPLILVISGFNSFFGLVSLVGGLFLSLQYVFIILTAKKVLVLSRKWKIFANVSILIFLLAAVYEIYYFIR